MKFKWENNLPFMSVKIVISGSTIELNHALIDTGAASSLFNVDKGKQSIANSTVVRQFDKNVLTTDILWLRLYSL